MEDDASIFLDGKTLANLRVVDLKLELEKRGLSKSGSKKDLVKRLKQQLEFEKLCGERKSTGDCDLKLELDADTEKNEFVQQYLAQQQKIYAEQKEVKRRVELEEIQRSGDEKESCDSTKGDDDKTEDEAEIEPDNQKLEAATNDTTIPSKKYGAGKKEEAGDVFDDEDTVHSPPANKDVTPATKKQTAKPVPNITDVEKDREKELSTAISSLLSVGQAENKDAEDMHIEDLTPASSAPMDRVVTRTSQDEDREKDLATAVLSSLLGDENVQDMEIETKSEEIKSRVGVTCKEEEAALQVEVSYKEVEAESQVGTTCKEVEAESQVGATYKEKEPESQVGVTCKEESQGRVTCNEVEAEPGIGITCKEEEAKSQVGDICKVVEAKLQIGVPYNVVEKSQVGVICKVVKAKSQIGDSCKEVKAELQVKDMEDESQIGVACKDEKGVAVPPRLPMELKAKTEDAKSALQIEVQAVEVSDSLAVELNVQSTVTKKDDGDVSLDVVGKPSFQIGEIPQSVEKEMSSKMDVSSVPYSLAEIELPESPANIAKSLAKAQLESESAKPAESDGVLQNSAVCEQAKNSEDLNGKDNSTHKESSPSLKMNLAKDGSNSDKEKAKKKDSDEKTRYVKEDSKSKRSKTYQSGSDSSSDEDSKARKTRRKDREHKKKRNSSDDQSPVKKSSDASKSRVEKWKDRRRSASLEVDERSKDRSRSPKKDSKLSRKDRNRKRSVSSDDDQRSRTRNKKSSSKKGSREGRRKHDRRHKSSSSGEDLSVKDNSPKKSKRIGRKERSVSSETERPSRTRSKESPKKEIRKERSVSSENEKQRSRTKHKESPKKEAKVDRVEQSASSGDERPSKARSQESPKKEPRKGRKERGHKRKTKSSDDEGASRMQISESSPKHTSVESEKPKDKEPKRIHRSESSEDEHSRKNSPVKRSKSDTETKSEITAKEEKMDCQSSGEEPVESSGSQRAVSPQSSKTSTRNKNRNCSRSRSRELSPERPTSEDKLSAVSPSRTKPGEEQSCHKKKSASPEVTRSRDSTPDKAHFDDPSMSSKRTPEGSPKKADVSEGELSSSRESSPASGSQDTKSKGSGLKTSPKPASALSKTVAGPSVPKQSTMTVIRKEVPKQRLKIKRDNVVILRKFEEEQEKLHKESQSKSDDAVSKDPEPIEDQKLEAGECPEVVPSTPYVSKRKITLSNRKQTEKPSDEPGNKRSKWGSFAASRKAKQTVSISTDSLKNWFPDFKLLKEPAVELVPEEPPSPAVEANEVEMVPVEKVIDEPTASLSPPEPKSSTVPRKVEQPLKVEEAVDSKAEEAVTPTSILFVRNLVRPFTLLQLKELLRETGNVVEEKFWIDKIKSKCFVTYETEEEAIKTRSALNGARWPTSNPKILAVDFATEDDLAYHRSGAVDQPKPLPPSSPPRQHLPQEESRRPMERDVRRDRNPVREWDKDKVTQESPEKPDRRREEVKVADKEKKEAKRRPNEDTPAKLLDDLFQKTKATPCIYWLPLTEEQVKERLERQQQIRLEKEQRNQERIQENKRPRSKQRMRETEPRRSSTRSRSPVNRRR